LYMYFILVNKVSVWLFLSFCQNPPNNQRDIW
jgi:hypothetical protein